MRRDTGMRYLCQTTVTFAFLFAALAGCTSTQPEKSEMSESLVIRPDPDPTDTTPQTLEEFQKELMDYHARKGSFPKLATSASQGRASVDHRARQAELERLLGTKSKFVDHWGTPLRYRLQSQAGVEKAEIWSIGPSGLEDWGDEQWKVIVISTKSESGRPSQQITTESRYVIKAIPDAMRKVSGMIGSYTSFSGHLPENLESLARPFRANLPKFREEMRLCETVPMDPWGRPFLYRIYFQSNDGNITVDELRSAGRDGAFHTKDDIVVRSRCLKWTGTEPRTWPASIPELDRIP